LLAVGAVELLLQHEARVESTGMYSWSALALAAKEYNPAQCTLYSISTVKRRNHLTQQLKSAVDNMYKNFLICSGNNQQHAQKHVLDVRIQICRIRNFLLPRIFGVLLKS
jgi:hypothetical protein